MKVDETREKILKVAAKLFGQFGFHRSTMDEIARTAHKAKGSLYYYFSNKEELFRDVVISEIESLKVELQRVIDEDGSATGMIKKYFFARMQVLRKATNYHQTLKADFSEKFEFLNQARLDLDLFENKLLKQILDRGVEEKTFLIRDTEKSAQVILIALKAFEIPFFLQNKIDEYEQTAFDLLDMLLKGLEKK